MPAVYLLGMTIVAILTVRRAAIHSYRAFERLAAEVMSEYGGWVERAIRAQTDSEDGVFREVHILDFPDEDAFAEYRADARLEKASALRAEAVAAIEIFIGDDVTLGEA